MEGLSTVKDVVRGMVKCDDEDQMLRFIEGVRACPELEIVQLKNYFAKLGPTHYRRIGLNVRVKLGDGGSHVAEIQVHQRDIERNAPDHKVYEYFRTLFVGAFDKTMDEWIALEARMQHLDAVMRVPVLMSLLIGDGRRRRRLRNSGGSGNDSRAVPHSDGKAVQKTPRQRLGADAAAGARGVYSEPAAAAAAVRARGRYVGAAGRRGN
jgi:hypothetical protein